MARIYFSLYLSLIFFIFINCQKTEEVTQVDSGRILIRLTDAPFPHHLVAEVNITVSKVLAIPVEGSQTGNSTSGALEFSSRPLTVNLLHLTNGITVTLTNTDIPVGRYKGLKLIIGEASIRLKDNTVFDLNLGNRNGSDYELDIPWHKEIQAGLTSDLLLDFDVSRSFIPRYASATNQRIAGFIFSPFVKLSDAYNSGSITGIVTSSLENKISRLEGAQITVMSADTVATTTFTDYSGMYTVLGLEPGKYNIKVNINGFDTQMIHDVHVNAQKQTKQGIMLTQLH